MNVHCIWVNGSTGFSASLQLVSLILAPKNFQLPYNQIDKLKYIQIVYSGATNVGSVDVYIDKDLKTNQWNGFKIGKHNRTNEFNEIKLPATNLTKGELLGQFNMGSTVVLIFEAPKQFK